IWAGLVLVAFAIEFFLIRTLSKNGLLLGVLIAILGVLMAWVILETITYQDASNRALSIAIGGGIGVIMLLNVWGIIWPAQKRIIAWTAANAADGTAIPAESATLARRAFLASRANTWLSVPMLFFMAAASHYPLFGG
ncbi:MAG: urate hydroxylase PuuD, partial [Candidatus Acidiferrales bacterium]